LQTHSQRLEFDQQPLARYNGRVAALLNFRRNLRELMRERGVSQRKLAEMAHTTYPYINRVLTGKVAPSLPVCDRIAEAMGVELVDLLREAPRSVSEELAAAFRENVRARMTALGLSQSELADALGVTPSYVSQLLSGHRRPGLDGLGDMASVLKTDPTDLLHRKVR
jgi:transcriptional regulator with XRE-family HTH domain